MPEVLADLRSIWVQANTLPSIICTPSVHISCNSTAISHNILGCHLVWGTTGICCGGCRPQVFLHQDAVASNYMGGCWKRGTA